MNTIIKYALNRNAFFSVSAHGLWLGCECEHEKAGYTCIRYFETFTLGL